MTAAQRGQVKHHGFNRLFHLHRNAAAFWQIERRQQIGHARAAMLQIGPAVIQTLAVRLNGLYRRFLKIRRKRSAQRAVKIGLMHVGQRDSVRLKNSKSKNSAGPS